MTHSRIVRVAIAISLLVLVAFLVWIMTTTWGSKDSVLASSAVVTTPIEPARSDWDMQAGETGSAMQLQRETPLVDVPVTPVVSAPQARPADVPTTVERPKIDLEAKAALSLLVVDERGQPVADARARLFGMRSEASPAAWYGYRGGEVSVTTDASGHARMEHWVWVNVDGRTSQVDLVVSHPDFVPFRDSGFPIGPGEHRVQLVRGSRVLVRAWFGSPANVIRDVEIQLESEAGLSAADWKLENGGFVTTRLAAGPHTIQVSRTKADEPLYSEVRDFQLGAGESEELSIELHAGETFEARLGDDVPRPVVEGRVLLVMQRREILERMDSPYRRFEGEIRADGTFTLSGVPRGRGHLFVLTRGWVSRSIRTDSAREAGTRFHHEPTPEENEGALSRLGDRAFLLPRILLPQVERPFVVAMEETGIVEIVVRDETGSPVADVTAVTTPNLRVPGVGSFGVPWGVWSSKTDPMGIARIENIPPQMIWIGAGDEEWRLRERDRRDSPMVSVQAGKVAHVKLVVERADPTKK